MTLGRKGWAFAAAFFIACPLLLALPLGMFQAGLGAFLPLELSVLFWALLWLLTWWLAEIFLRVLARFLKPWEVPLFASIVLAYALALLCSIIYVPQIMWLFEPYTSAGASEIYARLDTQSEAERALNGLKSGLAGQIFWTMLRTIYAALPESTAAIAEPVSPAAPKSETPVSPPPATPSEIAPLSKFRRELLKHGVTDLDRIGALKASDHYVEVTLSGAETVLVLSRFSDAIEDLTQVDGVRIHRSYWVSRAAIAQVSHDGGTMQITLANGDIWPVSTKYRGHVEHFIAHPPIASS